MALWSVERDAKQPGVVVASYANPPMSYFCAEGTNELRELTVRLVAQLGVLDDLRPAEPAGGGGRLAPWH